MKTIIVGFSTPKKFNLLSKIIRFIENSQYSHAYIKIDLEDIDRTVIYQASGLRVNFENIDSFNTKETVVNEWKLELTDNQYHIVLQFAIDNVGIPYGIVDLVGLGLKKLLRLKSNPFPSGKNSEVCCELVANILNVLGYLDSSVDIDSLDLNDLYKIMEDITNERKS